MKARIAQLSVLFVLLTVAMPLVSATWALDIQWYGQSAFKIRTPGGKVILIDPFITKNPKTPKGLKDLAKLQQVDLILLTHGHGDHVGDTAAISEMYKAKVALNADLGHTFAALGWVPYDRQIRFNKGGPIKPLGDQIKITMVHAEHSSEVVHTDTATNQKSVQPGGEPCGFIIELENGYKIYHAGDTGLFSDMAIIGDYLRPDMAMLPIGGHFTMDPGDAAYAVRTYLKTPKIIPMHYGTFGLLNGTPAQFKKALGDFPAQVIEMSPGELRSF
jgi:L-ascorbate metabolism protein UlaG (beta-lactamase superfamily)